MLTNKKYVLLNNDRFYVLAAAVLVSIFLAGFFRLQITNDQLFYIRLQQMFGLASVWYLYVALLVSPLKAVVGERLTRNLVFNRRAIGVSAFYFGLLHAAVALWGQLGGLSGVGYLPSVFQWSLLAGAVSLGVLAMLAITSFDRIIKAVTFKWWKALHRLVYGAGLLILLHIWSIGTHLAYSSVQITAFVMLVTLAGLELWKILQTMNKKYATFGRGETLVLFVCAWATIAGALGVVPLLVQSYHSSHSLHDDATKAAS